MKEPMALAAGCRASKGSGLPTFLGLLGLRAVAFGVEGLGVRR